MKKKLYFNLDSEDGFEGTMELSGCMEWIKGQELTKDTSEGIHYTLTPIWLTDKEFANLPEL